MFEWKVKKERKDEGREGDKWETRKEGRKRKEGKTD